MPGGTLFTEEGDIMKNKLSRTRNFFSVVSKDTHLWVIGVLVVAVVLSVSFYLEPLKSDFFGEGGKVSAAELKTSDPEIYNINTNLSERNKESDIDVNDIEVVTAGTNSVSTFSLDDYDALCRIVSTEAGTEDIEGQILITNVIMNRVASDKFPDTIQEVIESPGQFDPVETGAYYNVDYTDQIRESVIRALNGEDISEGALYFQKSESKYWGDHEYLFRHGNHSFYK